MNCAKLSQDITRLQALRDELAQKVDELNDGMRGKAGTRRINLSEDTGDILTEISSIAQLSEESMLVGSLDEKMVELKRSISVEELRSNLDDVIPRGTI